MDIILVSHARGRTWRLSFQPRRMVVWLPLAVCVLVLIGSCFFAGWSLRPAQGLLPGSMAGQWAQQVEQERSELQQARAKAEQDADALSRRVAELQAHMMRLDAAGSRMTQIAHIDPGEFNFDRDPPMGGPELPAVSSESASASDLTSSLDRLERQLNDRERQLRVLEDLLLAGRLQKEIKPAGWPVDSGYITSDYGLRVDPFTGLRTFHPGVDFAAPEGSKVLAVAAGIVVDAGERNGYGNMVEIDHGNGYVTRYGHNASIMVKPGERIRKGQAIALMGDTGRSTGPHVHFEVLLNGNTVNPEQYIDASR
jgi:murein DD-endopeptidase MepM/ murein hydrolase activator NlpD